MALDEQKRQALIVEITKNANSDVSLSPPQDTSLSGISAPNMDNLLETSPNGSSFPGADETMESLKTRSSIQEASFGDIFSSSFDASYARTASGLNKLTETNVQAELAKIKDATTQDQDFGIEVQSAIDSLLHDDLSPDERLQKQNILKQWDSVYVNKGAKKAGQIYLDINQQLASQQKQAYDDYESKDGISAWIAEFTGSLLGNLRDPVNLGLNAATAFIPLARGMGVASRIAANAQIFGTINAGLGIVDYNSIRRSAEAIGDKTNQAKVLTEGYLTGAAVGGGLVGGGILLGEALKALSPAAKKLFNGLKPLDPKGAEHFTDKEAALVAIARDAETNGKVFTSEQKAAIAEAEDRLKVMRVRPEGVSEADWAKQVQETTARETTLSDDWGRAEDPLPTEKDLNVEIKGMPNNEWKTNLEADLNQPSGLLSDLYIKNPGKFAHMIFTLPKTPEQRIIAQRSDNFFNELSTEFTEKHVYRHGASIPTRIDARVQRSVALMPNITRIFNDITDPFARAQLGEDFLKAVNKEPSSPEGIQLAREFQRMDDELVEGLDSVGIKVDKLDNWSPRPSIPAESLQQLGEEGYIEWGLQNMALLNKETGKAMTIPEMSELLRKNYNKVLLAPKSNKILSTKDYERKFTFKSAAHEMAFYHKLVPDFDMFQSILNYVTDASRNIEIGKSFGPDWQNEIPKQIQRMNDDAVKSGLLKPGEKLRRTVVPGTDRPGQVDHEMVVKVATDRLDPASNEATKEVLTGLRNAYSATALARSTIANLADVPQAALRKSQLKLEGNIWGDFFKNFTLNHQLTQGELAQKAIIMDTVLRKNGAAMRMDLDEKGAGKFARVTKGVQEFVFKTIGLNRLNRSVIESGAMELTTTLAHQIQKNKFTPEMDAFLTRYNLKEILPELSKSVYTQDGKLHFFELKDIESSEAQLRFASAVGEELRKFSLRPTTEVIAQITQGAEAGTAAGEAGRNLFFAKSFLVTQLLYQTRYALSRELPKGVKSTGLSKAWPKAKYAMTAATYLTLGGAAVGILQDLAKGRDIMNPTSSQFWERSINNGLGLGVFGDVLLNPKDAQKADALKYFGMIGFMMSQILLTMGGAKKSKAAWDLVNAFNPLSKHLALGPYGQKIFAEMPKHIFNEHPERDWRARRTKLRNDFGQDEWWKSEEWLPERLPEIGDMPREKED